MKKNVDLDEVAFGKLIAKDERLKKMCRVVGRLRILDVFKAGVKRGRNLKN